MTQETKSALLIGFIFIMIVLVVVVDGFDAGRTPALNDAPTDEMTIVDLSCSSDVVLCI